MINYYALAVGAAVVVFVIFYFKKTGHENYNIAYPVLLATFPVYYWFFSIYSNDYNALFYEVIVGILFIVSAGLAYKMSRMKSLALLALAFICHGIYDIIHTTIYSHSVAPSWWPEFCGVIDVFLGLYMLSLMKWNKSQKVSD
ncbi:hypothetical protein MHN79_06245 [Vibrio sp. Of14-4]|uniref:hypothetical protein n=1 Tax=Vibrio sp. Of14-4 TaxID=2724878 RepID=UPI001EF19B7D|nr:hypothetical protein [Vibrio sp. Of14-4]MCG7489082.1 hypothetical protein [Vibrio sp. Of14-4]